VPSCLSSLKSASGSRRLLRVESRLYLFRDLTEGKGSLNSTYFVTCPCCLHKGEYEARHHQHAARRDFLTPSGETNSSTILH